MIIYSVFFFFSSRRRHTRSLCDWSSDVCSSDLTLRAGGHVRVDIFYAEASARTKAIVDLIGALLLLLPFALTLIWLSLHYAARSWAILERSQEASGLPLVFLLKSLIPAFAGLMALQGVAQAIRAYAALTGPR